MKVVYRWLKIGVVAIAIIASGVAVPSVFAAPELDPVTPFSAPDIVNPQRGQYYNLGSQLFPQANPAQSQHPAWSGSVDSGNRYDWSQLQPVDPNTLPGNATDAQKYDFSAIDQDIALAQTVNARFSFRIMMYKSCCDSLYPANTNISVPSWLRNRNGATTDYVHSGVTHVIPNWNNDEYLDRVEDLIAALGRRYNKDERVAWYEFSGYGDFSENQNGFMYSQLGIEGPTEEDSEAQLGYHNQYRDQYITKSSVTRLTDATLDAFPDTQIIAAPNNQEVIRQLMVTSPKLAQITKPVGVRADCIGAQAPFVLWASEPDSWHVINNDPLVATIHDRWRTAPLITEWCNYTPGTQQEYYEKGLRDTVNYHISLLSSTGFPHQLSSTPMPLSLYSLWERANKYSGYRYAMTGATLPNNLSQGAQLPLKVTWTNLGVTPTYEKWNIIYDVRDGNGTTVSTTTSPLSLSNIRPAQNYSNLSAEPTPASNDDSLSLPTSSLPLGNYTVHARVAWNEHKSGGTNAVNFEPMSLAMGGRDAADSYKIASFSVVTAPAGGTDPGQNVPGATSPQSAVPGAPNTGFERVVSAIPLVVVGIVLVLAAAASLLVYSKRLK